MKCSNGYSLKDLRSFIVGILLPGVYILTYTYMCLLKHLSEMINDNCEYPVFNVSSAMDIN